MADDVVITFFTGQNGLQYLQEFVPTEEKTTAMVAMVFWQWSSGPLQAIVLICGC